VSAYDDPKFREWAADRKDRVLAALNRSGTIAALLTEPFTLERLDKPLILCVSAGTKCPEGLTRAAARIVEFDEPVDAPSNIERLKAAIDEVGLA
jgi:hypothetical protein